MLEMLVQPAEHVEGAHVEREGVALVGIVGPGLAKNAARVTGRGLVALARKDIDVRLVSSAVSQTSFNMLVPSGKMADAVRLLHRVYHLDRKPKSGA